MRLTVIKVVERRILFIFGKVSGILLTLRLLNDMWRGLNREGSILGRKQVSRMVIRRWDGGTRLQVALSHTSHCCGTGSSFVGYYPLICLLLGSSLPATFRIGMRMRKQSETWLQT